MPFVYSYSRFRNVAESSPAVRRHRGGRARGVMKCVSEVRECIELRSAFQNYTTVISSTEIHANNCV